MPACTLGGFARGLGNTYICGEEILFDMATRGKYCFTDAEIRKISLWIVAASVALQVVLISVFWGAPMESDAKFYVDYAMQCHMAGEWYPMRCHLNDFFLVTPGLVNFYILQLNILGTLNFNMLFNLLMACGITYLIFKIAKHHFGAAVGYITIALWSLLYSNWMIVLPAMTELPFLLLCLAAYYAALAKRRWVTFLLCGVLLAVANWIRPLVVIFLPTMLAVMYFRRLRAACYVALFAAMAAGILIIAQATRAKIGVAAFQSSTMGINLIMSANDKAYGGVAAQLFYDPSSICYIENRDGYTFAQKDSIWTRRAVEWILDNPGKYAKLYPLKVGGVFFEDSWPDRPVMFGKSSAGIASIGMSEGVFSGNFIKRFYKRIAKSAVYYIVMILALCGLVSSRRSIARNWRSEGSLLLILIIGVAVTCLFSVCPRYHYPFLFVLVAYAARFVYGRLRRGQGDGAPTC